MAEICSGVIGSNGDSGVPVAAGGGSWGWLLPFPPAEGLAEGGRADRGASLCASGASGFGSSFVSIEDCAGAGAGAVGAIGAIGLAGIVP